MSERAREFLDQWYAKHIQVVPDAQRLRETVRLVAACRIDAIRAGILPAQLRVAAGGDLVRSTLAALGEAARRKNDAPKLAEPPSVAAREAIREHADSQPVTAILTNV